MKLGLFDLVDEVLGQCNQDINYCSVSPAGGQRCTVATIVSAHCTPLPNRLLHSQMAPSKVTSSPCLHSFQDAPRLHRTLDYKGAIRVLGQVWKSSQNFWGKQLGLVPQVLKFCAVRQHDQRTPLLTGRRLAPSVEICLFSAAKLVNTPILIQNVLILHSAATPYFDLIKLKDSKFEDTNRMDC